MKKKATVNLRSSRRVTAKQGTVKQKLTDAQPPAVHPVNYAEFGKMQVLDELEAMLQNSNTTKKEVTA